MMGPRIGEPSATEGSSARRSPAGLSWRRRLPRRPLRFVALALVVLLGLLAGAAAFTGGALPLGARRARHGPAPPVPPRSSRPAQRTSDFHGVSWHESTSQWQAHVPDPTDEVPVSLGLFGSERDAAKAFDRASLAIGGPSAATNFPAAIYEQADINEEERRFKDSWQPRPSSQYHGVYQTRGSKRWKAEIELYGIRQFLDFFDDEVEAAHAVDNAIRSTGIEKVLQLKLLNFRRNEDYFDEDTWEQEKIPRGATSHFLGVSYHQPSGRFLAKLGRKHIGVFDTELEAARAFDDTSRAAGGPTNFQLQDG